MQQHMQEMYSCGTNLIGAIKWSCLRHYFSLVQSTSAVEGKVYAHAYATIYQTSNTYLNFQGYNKFYAW